jgi:hypothetical protein
VRGTSGTGSAASWVPEPVTAWAQGPPQGRESGAVGTVEGVRLQEFRTRMDDQFGAMRAQSVARDHVFGTLGGRSALEAIDAGVPVRTVWLEICKEYDVPPKDR